MLLKKLIARCLVFFIIVASPAFAVGNLGFSEANSIPLFTDEALVLNDAELAEVEGEGLGGAAVGAAVGAVFGSIVGAVGALMDSASGRHDKAWETFKTGLVTGIGLGVGTGFLTNPF
jgi:hypothetical protein